MTTPVRKLYDPPTIVAEVSPSPGQDLDACIVWWHGSGVRQMTHEEREKYAAALAKRREYAAALAEAEDTESYVYSPETAPTRTAPSLLGVLRLGDVLLAAIERKDVRSIEQIMDAVPRCSKGCCLTPATRLARYRCSASAEDGGDLYVEQPSCDNHGIDEGARDYSYAEALRAAETTLVAAGRSPWWIGEDGSGGNRAPVPEKRGSS